MADALVEQQQSARFFCHRCNIEFEDVLQDYTCPYCASGFIEQLDSESDGSDADMSNLDDSDEQPGNRHPMLSDIALLMSGRRVRRTRPDSLLEQLMWSLGGSRTAGPGGAGGTGRAPFLLVGAPGDYVFGGEGLDAVVTQMLGQLENAGPPPLSREQIEAIPTEAVSPEHAATNASCSVCWENFLQDEKVSRLECEHVFHSACIEPWLRLHATCPICRRSLLRAEAGPERPAPLLDLGEVAPPIPPPRPPRDSASQLTPLPRVVLRRLPLRLISGHQTHAWDSPAGSGGSGGSGSGSGSSGGSSVSAGGVWAPHSRSTTTSTGSNSSTSLHSNTERDRQQGYNMDIDYD